MQEIQFTKNRRVSIVQRAREILSDRNNWTVGKLRARTYKSQEFNGFSFCLLGACEQALYELGFVQRDKLAFSGAAELDAYSLGRKLGLRDYSVSRYGTTPDAVNDTEGYEKVLELLDGFLEKEMAK